MSRVRHPLLLEAVLRFLPLDTYVENPALVMAVVQGDNVDPVIWKEYARILRSAEGREIQLAEIERAVEKLGLNGVHLFTPMKGRPLCLDNSGPIFEKMAAYDLPIWIHPVRPIDRIPLPFSPSHQGRGTKISLLRSNLVESSAGGG
jgi:hypothetical protein